MSKNVQELIQQLTEVLDQLNQIPNPETVKVSEFSMDQGGYSDGFSITEFDLSVDIFNPGGDDVVGICVTVTKDK